MTTENTNETVDQGSNEFAAELADLKAQNEKLNAKNKELIAEKQQHKQAAMAAEEAKEEAALQAAERSGDIEALKAAHAKEIAKLTAKNEQLDGDLRTIRVDNEIANSLAKGNIRPEMTNALTALLKSQVAYENGQATIEGTSIADYVSSYLGGDEGSHFVRAADNSGAGATGSTNTTAPSNWTAADITGARSMEFQKLAASDPAKAQAIAQSAGLTGLSF